MDTLDSTTRNFLGPARRNLVWLLGIPIIIACCLVGAPLYLTVRGERVARGLMPSEYPGSTLVKVERWRFANIRHEKRKYATPDAVASVLAFMERDMPGFVRHSRERYRHQRQDDSLPSLITILVVKSGVIESAIPAVAVEVDDDGAAGTEITVTLSWPDP